MSSFFQIKSPLSRGSHVDLDDSLRTKQTLRGLGFFKTPSYGLTPYPDEPLFEAIEGFQRRHGLKVDGVMKPGGETARTMDALLSRGNQPRSGERKLAGGLLHSETPEQSRPTSESRENQEQKRPFPAWPGLFPGKGGTEHHERNRHQQCPPQSPEAGHPDWDGKGNSNFHCGYESRRGRTGGPKQNHQCVYDKDGKIVDDPACRGSFDRISPYNKEGKPTYSRVLRHYRKDIFPWLLYGN